MIMDWLRKIASRSPAPPEPDAAPKRHDDILLSAERDAILASHLSASLAALGLVQVAPRRWVDGSTPPVRRVFEMALVRSNGMKASWGFSLDFVPHFSMSGHKLYWHRTDRTAMLDITVYPRDLDKARYGYGAEWLHRDLGRLLPIAIARAQETWRRGATWRGMLDIVAEIRERKSNQYWFDMYRQMPLAVMFLLAKTGDLTAAQAAFEAYILKRKLSEDVAAKLGKLVRDAASAPTQAPREINA